jgi:predicted GH43/DUF377 family glycosyl hydrolase
MTFQIHNWKRDGHNPVFPPGTEDFDSTACMNPFVLRRGDEYWMYYAGGNAKGQRHICLAIADVNDLTHWDRKGPLFELGAENAFDEHWTVLPCVHRVGNLWHLYYTGQGKIGQGLQSFRGIGLAQSDDLIHWRKFSSEPVIEGNCFPEWPGNAGIAGGGRIIEVPAAHGEDKQYRMYYTLAVGISSPDVLVDQEKVSVVAHSHDGINWFDHRIVLERRAEATYENAAVIALNVWQTPTKWRSIYAGIGTRFGAYSICEAESADGLNWHRGEPGENLVLAPSKEDGNGHWADQMTEYPNVVEENGKLRLFYCGNGYGTTGIGSALAEKIA